MTPRASCVAWSAHRWEEQNPDPTTPWRAVHYICSGCGVEWGWSREKQNWTYDPDPATTGPKEDTE